MKKVSEDAGGEPGGRSRGGTVKQKHAEEQFIGTLKKLHGEFWNDELEGVVRRGLRELGIMENKTKPVLLSEGHTKKNHAEGGCNEGWGVP